VSAATGVVPGADCVVEVFVGGVFDGGVLDGVDCVHAATVRAKPASAAAW
jgi:hypothetical protein